MHRTISDYKITKRKDGRYYVRIRDKGDVTHIYGKTKAEVKSKLEIKIEELNTLDRRRTEQSFLPETSHWQTGRIYASTPFVLPLSAEIPMLAINGTSGYTLAS